jgi:hypothetical protein
MRAVPDLRYSTPSGGGVGDIARHPLAAELSDNGC